MASLEKNNSKWPSYPEGPLYTQHTYILLPLKLLLGSFIFVSVFYSLIGCASMAFVGKLPPPQKKGLKYTQINQPKDDKLKMSEYYDVV
jgi:hypothetical protein